MRADGVQRASAGKGNIQIYRVDCKLQFLRGFPCSYSPGYPQTYQTDPIPAHLIVLGPDDLSAAVHGGHRLLAAYLEDHRTLIVPVCGEEEASVRRHERGQHRRSKKGCSEAEEESETEGPRGERGQEEPLKITMKS